MYNTLIFDLDGTVIDSSHRYAKLPDGSIDLVAWIKNCTRDKILQDKLLPLAKVWRQNVNKCRIAICTSRIMTDHDLEFLRVNGLEFNDLMSRPAYDNTACPEFKRKHIKAYLDLFSINPVSFLMFEDHAGVRETVKTLGVDCLDPIHYNRRGWE